VPGAADGPAQGQRLSARVMTGHGCRAWPLRPRAGARWEGSRRLAHSPARPRASVDPRQRVRAAGTAYPSLAANSWGEGLSVNALVVNLVVVALVVDASVAVGSADSGQGGPVRIRGGSSGERWRSGPVRSGSF